MQLPDKRLDDVLEVFIDRIKNKQTLSMRKLSENRSEEVQFGRFIGNDRVSVADLEKYMYHQMSTNGQQASHILLLEDTSQMGFGLNRSIEGLGKVDKGQVKGFYLHPVLAIDANNGACYGIPAVEFHCREWEQETRSKKELNAARNKVPFEEKQGYRWHSSIEKSLQHCRHIEAITMVGDRESDIYAVLTGLKDELRVDYVIRSRHNRPLQNGEKLLQQVDQWSEEFHFQLTVPPTDKRSAHKASLIVKFGQVVLKQAESKTTKKLPPTHCTRVVEVKESPESVINGEEPIHWVLLTSHQVNTIEMAMQVVEWYKQRWNIEQIFRTLKTKGLRIQSSQLSDYEKLKKITILALIGAVKVLQLVRARDGETLQPISTAFDDIEQKFIHVINKHVEGNTEKLKNPHPPDSLAFAAWTIARLSGWSGYKSQRPPGPIDFHTGLQRFYERLQGFLLAYDT
jgi:hypothetical protein